MPWLDGTLHAEDMVPFDITDRGLLLGDGVFDTSLVIAGRMVWREAHVERLLASTRALDFVVARARIEEAIEAVLAGAIHGALRITCTRGPGRRGLWPSDKPRPTVLASLAPLNTAAMFAPIALHIADIRRNDTSPASRLKSLGYLDAVLASGAARAAGCDDALFLNTRGRVACTSVGNVFALMDGHLVTPPLDDGIVGGIVREVLLRTCGTVGLEPKEASLDIEDIFRADAIFATNSLRLVSPVTAVGGKSLIREPHGTSVIAQIVRMTASEAGIDRRDVTQA